MVNGINLLSVGSIQELLKSISNYFENSKYGEFVGIFLTIGIAILAHFIILKIFGAYKNHDKIHLQFTKNILIAANITITFLSCMSFIPSLSQTLSTIIASSGLIAVVIGLAAQESLGNIFNGIFISIFKPFEVGDRIRLVTSNIVGYVEDISLRHTIIRTFTNSRLIIPNSVINKEVIENSHFKDVRASNFIDVQISYESNIDLAIETMKDVISGHPSFIDFRSDKDKKENKELVTVFVKELGEHGIHLRASMWTKDVDASFVACSDVRLALKKAFDEQGIEIPYNRVKVVH